MKKETLMKLFDDAVEYPKWEGEILPFGTFYEYAGTTVLDAFINHVTIISAFVISRYSRWDEIIDNEISYMEGNEWKQIDNITKKEAYDLLISKDNVHVKLDTYFNDDVLILARKEDTDEFWFFWFDRDVSDSCIGRFKSVLPEKKIIKLFENYVEEMNIKENVTQTGDVRKMTNTLEEYKSIPLSYFKGWISG